MASYAADIQIGVKGKAQLNQLEKQLTRVNTAVKQLNKALTLKTRAQTIKLNTKGAMNAVRDLEKRINKLGRTITVNLRVNEKEGKKAQSGGNSSFIAAKGSAASTTALAAAVNTTRELTNAEKARNQIAKELAPALQKQENLYQQIAEQTEKINRNRKEAQNIERGFGSKGRLNQLNFGYDALNKKLQRLKTEYQGVTSEVQRYGRAAERVNDRETILAEKRRQRASKRMREVEQMRSKRRSGRAVGVGLGAAATQIPGLGGIATGALGGAAVGGRRGALLGGLTAGFVELSGALIRFGKNAAITAAEVKKLQISLRNVAGSSVEYEQALSAIAGVVEDFNAPLDQATAQFTKLTAAGKASGFTIGELETVYRGLAAANKAFGGDAERLQGILLATTQVFSKGKVQAEELRGQIGERLPGAFALFAKATGRSTKELDKAMEQGKVTLKDFVKFAEKLLAEYEDDAKLIADAPQEAGERLKKSMTSLRVQVGGELARLGAAFQTFADEAIKALQRVLTFLGRVGAEIESRLGGLSADALENATQRLERAQKGTRGNLQTILDPSSTADQIRAAQKNLKMFEGFAQKAQADIDALKLGPELITPPTVEDIVPDGGGSVSKGGGSAGRQRESQVPQLQRELALEQELFRLQGLYNQAELKGNEDLQIQIQARMDLAELAKQELDIRASDIPDNEKLLEILRNQVAVRTAGQEEAQQLALLDKERKETIEGSVRAFNNEVALLGERNEAARELLQIEQDIVELQIQAKGKFTQEQIQAYRQAAQGAAAAREEQRQYNEVLGQVQGPVNALVGGLKEVVAGTKTAEEAFVDFLNTIADQLIQTAATMIAEYIAIGIARAFAGIPSSGSGSTSSMSGFFNPNVFQAGPFSGFGVGGYAEGGYVTGPQPAVVGEGGEPEYIIPASKMDGAMARYSGGTRGDAVIDGPGSAEGGGGVALADAPISITVEGGVTQFGGNDYIRKDQLPAIVEQASKAGEARTMRKLQMSPGARRKIGM